MTKRLSTLAVLLFGLLALSAGRQDARVPPDAKALLGKSPDAVIAAFGVPEKVQASAETLRFEYSIAAAQPLAIVIHDGMVVGVSHVDAKPAQIRRPVRGQLHLGMSMRDALPIVGNSTQVTVHGFGANLQPEKGGVVFVSQGRVVYFERPRKRR